LEAQRNGPSTRYRNDDVTGLHRFYRNPSLFPTTSGLLENAINLVLIFQFEHLGRVVVFDTLPVQQEPDAIHVHSFLRGVRLEYLAHLGGLLDLEKGLFSVLFAQGIRNEEDEVSDCAIHIVTAASRAESYTLVPKL
jgi:hypothetical protein